MTRQLTTPATKPLATAPATNLPADQFWPARSRQFPPVPVYIPPRLKHDLDLYIKICKLEISGFGTVDCLNGRPTITGLYLLEQQVTGAETELSEETILDFLSWAMQNGVDVSKIRLWWHSHADYQVGWSPTDEKTIALFSHVPWFISVVGNHQLDYLARVDVFPSDSIGFRLPHEAVLTIDHAPEDVERIRDEIKQKVRRKAVVKPKVVGPTVKLSPTAAAVRT